MTVAIQALNIQKLSVEERLELIDVLWESITDRDALFKLTEEEKQELDRRVADAEAHPETGMTWEEVRDRLRKRRKSSRTT